MLFNTPAPEESLSSYVVRQLIIKKPNSSLREARGLFHCVSKNHWRHFPRSSPEINHIFINLFDNYSFSSILEKHTLLPLYVHVANGNLYNYMKRTLVSGKTKWHRHFDAPPVHFAEQTHSLIKYCPQCFEDQIYNFGFSWFKREWQIHGMIVCQMHNCDLNEATCRSCKNKQPLSLVISALQGYCQKCKAKFWYTSHSNESEGYTNWLVNLLHVDIENVRSKLCHKSLIVTAYNIVRQKQLFVTIDPTKSKIGHFFSDLYSPFFFKYYEIYTNTVRYNPSSMIAFSDHLDVAISSARTFPLDCLFFPIYLAFPEFTNFIKHIEEKAAAEESRKQLLAVEWGVQT